MPEYKIRSQTDILLAEIELLRLKGQLSATRTNTPNAGFICSH